VHIVGRFDLLTAFLQLYREAFSVGYNKFSKGFFNSNEVAGEEYNLPMVMPGFAANANMSDQDYADIATYLRNSWGNIASAIDAETVAELRKQTASRKTPYQASEFAN